MPGINRYGNNKNVLKTAVRCVLLFPELSFGKSNKIFTKHFTNLLAWMDNEPIALFGFLIYQTGTDNLVKYTTKVLQQYAVWIRFLEKKKRLRFSVPNARLTFKYLIETGLLMPTTDEKFFLINPNLVYSASIHDHKFYKSWKATYQTKQKPNNEDMIELSSLYINHLKNK